MSFRRVCVLLLVAQSWGATWGRPSESVQEEATAVAAGGGTEHTTPKLLNRTALLAGCSHHLDAFSTPQEIDGDWCNRDNPNDSDPDSLQRYAPPTCNRASFHPVGDNLRVVLRNVRDGQITMTKNVTFSQIDNESWLSQFEGRTANIFIGLSSDRKSLMMCGTSTLEGQVPLHVSSVALTHCLRAGEEEAADGQPSAIRCDLPQAA